MALYHLLAIGSDPSVLATRADVLKQAGYLVSIASSESSACHILDQANFDLVIVCHTFSPSDRRRVVEAARRSNSRPRVISINRGPETEMAADATIHSLDGPDALLRSVAEVLGEGTGRVQRL
jgi:DNA-binding response OmpR family regulator